MKRKLAVIITVFSVIISSSISYGKQFIPNDRFFKSFGWFVRQIMIWGTEDREKRALKENLDQLLLAIQTGNKNEVIKLFAKDTLDEAKDLEQNAQRLIFYFEGEVLSQSFTGGRSSMSYSGLNGRYTIYNTPFIVKTTKEDYRIAIHSIDYKGKDSEKSGIYSLYIIKENEIPEEKKRFNYYGEKKEVPGIHIGVLSVD